MLSADDSALVQLLVDRFYRAADQFSLKINIKKTECLYQPVKLLQSQPEPEVITINQEPLVHATNLTYLGSTVSSNAKLEKELRNRLGQASKAFGNLRQKHVFIRAKCKAYRAVVLSTLLYEAEIWTI